MKICSICNKENHNVEGDFCVFCGGKLTNKPNIIEPKNKKIDKRSNKNLNQKSNNNHGNDNFFFITTIILIIILILLGGFTAYYIISDKSPELEKEITSLKQKNTKLSNEKSSLEQTNRKNASKIDFFDKHVVFVLEGYGNFYYTYDQMLQVTQGKSSYSYWAYNIEQAIDLGYKPLQ